MQPIPYFGERLNRSDWMVEPKIDGWRMQILCQGDGKVEFWGRRLEKRPNWTDKLKSLSRVPQKTLKPGTLIDAEPSKNRSRTALAKSSGRPGPKRLRSAKNPERDCFNRKDISTRLSINRGATIWPQNGADPLR